MSCLITLTLVFLVLYALLAYIRRKIAKPNYTNKLIWITGASSGLGEYLAYEFNRNGADLILSARNVSELKRVQQNCHNPSQVQIVKMDMANFGEVEKVTKEVLSKL